MKHGVLFSRGRLWTLLFILGFTLQASAQTGGIRGNCIGYDGEVLVDHKIVLKPKSYTKVYETKTKKKGQYIHIGLPGGVYAVELLTPEGKSLYTIEVRINISQIKVQNFDLAKEREIQEEDPEYLAQAAEVQEEQVKQKEEFLSLKEHFDLGNTYLRQKNYDEAIFQFERALGMAKIGNLSVILTRIADTHTAAGKLPEAEENYLKALELQPDSPGVRNNYGQALARMGRLEEALGEIGKAAELNPDRAAQYYLNLGIILTNAGKMDDSAVAFEKSIEFNPELADAYYLHAQALMGQVTMDIKTGETNAPPELIMSLESYLGLAPEGKYAGNAKMLLQTMTGKIETNYKAPSRRRRRRSN